MKREEIPPSEERMETETGVKRLIERVERFKKFLKERGINIGEDLGQELSKLPPSPFRQIADKFIELASSSIRSIRSIRSRIIPHFLLALELIAAGNAFAQERPPVEVLGDEPGIAERVPDLNNYLRLAGVDWPSVWVKHNFHQPESLWECLQMLIEPVDFVIKVPYQHGDFTARIIEDIEAVRVRIRNMLGGETESGRKDTTLIQVEFPYEYAEDFEKASPVDKERMKQEMLDNAQKLLQALLPTIYGPTFFEQEVREKHGTLAGTQLKLRSMQITGYASPESEFGVNLEDPRNQRLSELRAENAATILSEYLKSQGVEIGKISTRGEGEIPLTESELSELAKEAYRLQVSSSGVPKDQAVFKLIEQYNDGIITEAVARKKLDKLVGAKRKVMVEVDMPDRRAIFVIPVPLLLFLLLLLRRSRRPDVRVYFMPGSLFRPPNPREIERARGFGRSLRNRDVLWLYAHTPPSVSELPKIAAEAAPHPRKREKPPLGLWQEWFSQGFFPTSQDFRRQWNEHCWTVEGLWVSNAVQWYLQFGDQRPDAQTWSPREVAEAMAYLLYRSVRLGERARSIFGSRRTLDVLHGVHPALAQILVNYICEGPEFVPIPDSSPPRYNLLNPIIAPGNLRFDIHYPLGRPPVILAVTGGGREYRVNRRRLEELSNSFMARYGEGPRR